VPDKLYKYTAIISDLHLTDEQHYLASNPLWKKYKTREFFFDDDFQRFLDHIVEKAEHNKIELILNGDIFDFDSVMTLPQEPTFRVSWLERKRTLEAASEKATFKVQTIVNTHRLFFDSLKEFINKGNKVVFVIGNHDVELHFKDVQEFLYQTLGLNKSIDSLQFVEWFYISNYDTLIEHGNQYDPYCLCEDPINPFCFDYNKVVVKLPFGNLACRYILNGMGFFNPHIDSNYIMGFKEYLVFFWRYMLKGQPTVMIDWLFGATVTLWRSFYEGSLKQIRDPLRVEARVEEIAKKANATPQMVRELKELFASAATQNIFLMAKEMWLDRAFLIFVGILIVFQLMLLIKQFFMISIFWMLVPIFLLLPFFLFYSRSVDSKTSDFKEPDEEVLRTSAAITKVNRVIYGHTHLARHEIIGGVEHLNSGCWSPAFSDVECTKPIDQKTYVWIYPTEKNRKSELLRFDGFKSQVIKGSLNKKI